MRFALLLFVAVSAFSQEDRPVRYFPTDPVNPCSVITPMVNNWVLGTFWQCVGTSGTNNGHWIQKAATGPIGPPGPAATGFVTTTYKFTRTPGGTLTAATPATVTLTTVPFGVNGSDSGHYVYISGGTGTAEAVLITGGTALSGAPSGTIIFTPANNHSGAWTVTSSSDGLQETLNVAAANGGGTIFCAPGTTLHQVVTAPAGPLLAMTAGGNTILGMTRASDYANGDLMLVLAGTSLSFFDIGIQNGVSTAQTSGAAIHWISSSPLSSNLAISNGFIGELLEGASVGMQLGLIFVSVNGNATPPNAAVKIIGHSLVPSADLHFVGCELDTAPTSPFVVDIRGADTIYFNGCTIGDGQTQMGLEPDTGYNVQGIYIDNTVFDTSSTVGIAMEVQNAGTTIANVRVANSLLIGESNPTTLYGISIGSFSAFPGQIFNVQITGNSITRWGAWGLVDAATRANSNVVIIGNIISNNNTNNAGTVGGLWLLGADGVTVTGNTIGDGNTQSGVLFQTSLNRITLVGNSLGNSATPINFNGILATKAVISNNEGVTNLVPAVASSAALSFPGSPFFTVTGNTNITSVNGGLWQGASGTLITTGAGITFTAGATIGNTITTTQNVPVSWVFDGTKVWLH